MKLDEAQRFLLLNRIFVAEDVKTAFKNAVGSIWKVFQTREGYHIRPDLLVETSHYLI